MFPASSALAISNDLLNVKISGVKGNARQNVIAHLGTLPKNKAQRRAFLFNSRTNVQAALESIGFYEAKVETELTKTTHSAWIYAIAITLGTPIKITKVDIAVDGELALDKAYTDWHQGIPIKQGDVLNHGLYENTKAQLIGLALENGYFDGKYQSAAIKINRFTRTAIIELHYNSGKRFRFGQVSFSGTNLEPELLNRLIPFKIDDFYATSKIAAFNSSLSQTGYFRSIKVLPQLDKTNGQLIPIKVDLQRRDKHTFELGFGADFGTSSEREIDPRISVTWITPQINRYGHSQKTSIEWSRERPKFRTTYTIPLTHPINDQLKIQLGLLRDKYGVSQTFDENSGDYTTTGKLESEQFLYGVGRQQIFANNWIMNYSIQSLKEIYTQQDVDYDPLFYLFGLSFSRTIRSDDTLDPKSGFRQDYNFKYSDKYLGSEIRLAKIEANYKWIFTPFDRHRFVSRLDLGINIAKSDQLALIPPSLRYFAGGDQSIRGYAFQELGPYIDYSLDDQKYRQVIGGRYLAVGSIEYQYYLTPKWRIATFIDAGNAYDISQYKPLVSSGLGLHWISPVGPIRLDLGVGLNNDQTASRPWRIHLTMGSEL